MAAKTNSNPVQKATSSTLGPSTKGAQSANPSKVVMDEDEQGSDDEDLSISINTTAVKGMVYLGLHYVSNK